MKHRAVIEPDDLKWFWSNWLDVTGIDIGFHGFVDAELIVTFTDATDEFGIVGDCKEGGLAIRPQNHVLCRSLRTTAILMPHQVVGMKIALIDRGNTYADALAAAAVRELVPELCLYALVPVFGWFVSS